MKRWLFVPFAAIMIAGCSNIVETRISSTGLDALSPATFFIAPDATTSLELRNAYGLVSNALSERGYKAADNGALYLEVTLASRPATLALGTAKGPNSLSPAKPKRPLQNCDDREYRISIILTQVGDGGVAYQGNAAEYHCNMPMAEAVSGLIEAALADVGKPRGSYAVKHKAQN